MTSGHYLRTYRTDQLLAEDDAMVTERSKSYKHYRGSLLLDVEEDSPRTWSCIASRQTITSH